MISKLSFELLCLAVIATDIGLLIMAIAVRRLIRIFKANLERNL